MVVRTAEDLDASRLLVRWGGGVEPSLSSCRNNVQQTGSLCELNIAISCKTSGSGGRQCRDARWEVPETSLLV
jgi:hypothetical protein